MKTIKIQTKKDKEVIDITNLIERELIGVKEGLAALFLLHTSAALTTADLDPGTDLDMIDAFKQLVPKLQFRHQHDPEHTPDHILSTLIGASLTVRVKDSKIYLGSWQRVVLIEFNGPKEREVVVQVHNNTTA